jgi:hypothetical protein
MAKCGCCGREGLRKVQLVNVLYEDGQMSARKVGECCADRGVTIVASRAARVTVVNERRGQREVLEPFVKNLRARLLARRAMQPNYADADEALREASYAEGYEQAIEDVVGMLQEGRA